MIKSSHLFQLLQCIFGAVTLLAGLLVGFYLLVNISAEAKPTWLESRIATALLSTKISVLHPAKTPPFSPTEKDWEEGRKLYHQRCGFPLGDAADKAAPLGSSLSPSSPQFLIHPSSQIPWKNAYIIRHGIRWTGMPAFHGLSEADAWRIALFIQSPAKVTNTDTTTAQDALGSLRPFRVGLSVPDAKASARWYEEKLGFSPEGDAVTAGGTRMIVVTKGSFAVELLQIKKSFAIKKYDPAFKSSSMQLQGIVKVAFAVDDLNAALKQLVDRHVQVVQSVTDVKQFSVRFFLIEDNNGYLIQIFQGKKH